MGSGEITLDVLIDSIQSKFDSTSSLKGSFIQTSFLKSLRRNRISSGKVFFKKPGKMRWEYTAPEKQLIVSNGNIFWFYIPKDRQVIKSELSGELDSSAPNLFLMGKGRLRDLFIIEKGITSEKKYSINLYPKEAHPTIKEIIFRANDTTFLVEETVIIDYYGNKTSVKLSGLETNSNIKEEEFTFYPPEGVRVIGNANK